MSQAAPRIVAVDGPAASGKTTLARRLAADFGLEFLDTGLLYRAVARALLDAGHAFDDVAAAAAAATGLGAADLAAGGLRDEVVSQGASRVAAIPEVRRALLAFQRRFGSGRPGRGSGRARHRHRGPARRRLQDLRHRLDRGARAAALQGVAGRRRAVYI